MDERFTYLVEKFLDHDLRRVEKLEFKKYLENPDCIEYLEKAKVVDKFINEEMRQMLADPEMMENLFSEPGEFDKQIDEDIARFGGSDISDETRETVRKMHENMLAGIKRKRITIFAAFAASVLFGLFFLWPSHPKPSVQLLYKQYYKTFDYITTRSASETIPAYNKAVYSYMGGEYKASARLCREIILTDTAEAEIHFLYGLNLMEMDSMQSAIQQFQTTTSFPLDMGGMLYVSANWYESLCWLSLGRTDSTMVKLEVIRGGDNLFVRTFRVDELEEGIRGLKGKK